MTRLHLSACAVLLIAQIPAFFAIPCYPMAGSPLTIPLPIPSVIPLGNFCTCKSVAIKPALLPPSSSSCLPPPSAGIPPALLKSLLPMLPSLLAPAPGCLPPPPPAGIPPALLKALLPLLPALLAPAAPGCLPPPPPCGPPPPPQCSPFY